MTCLEVRSLVDAVFLHKEARDADIEEDGGVSV